MKKLFSSKSFLTMMSILSILLGFALLCGASLAALHYFGVVTLFSEEEEVTVSADMEHLAGDLPDYTKTPQAVVGVGTEGLVPETLIKEIPFADTYYAKLEVHSDTKDGAFAEGIYEIWRYRDKYRIHRYHLSDNEVEHIMICDGARVMITNFAAASIAYEDYGAQYAFAEVAPFPNFRKLFLDVHFFTSYKADGDTCSFSCEYPSLGVTDHVEFSKATGIVSSYRRMHGANTLLSVEAISITDRYDVMDYMFSFD